MSPVPPLIGFFAKQMVLSAALDNGYIFISLLAIFTSVIGALWFRTSHLCQQLSNSGDTLKLLIPNHNWKIVGEWINYSCRVISQKMIEKEIGNRGSKSTSVISCWAKLLHYKSAVVKEQRVNGSCHRNFMWLNYTLMAFERNYQVKILSKKINSFSSALCGCSFVQNNMENVSANKIYYFA